MRFPAFIGPSYTLQSVNVDCQRCVNLYPEINELGTGKEREVAALVSPPGLRPLSDFSAYSVANGMRGLYAASTGELFALGGQFLFLVLPDWTYRYVGTLSNSVGAVSWADNGTQVVLVDDGSAYSCSLDGSSFAQITDPAFPGASQVTFQDGYFIFSKPDSEQFFLSGINSLDFDALDIGSAEGSPDNLVGLISDHQNLYLFGSLSTEVWYDSGASNFPFERVQGAIIEVGCASSATIARIQGTIFWLGLDAQGRGIVYRTQGYQPVRISTYALEKILADVGDASGASAWSYQQSGHTFYCLNVPGFETTWVYDLSTQLWHERATFKLGRFSPFRVSAHAFAYGTNVVSDGLGTAIYALDPTIYTDDGDIVVRERTAPHFSQDMLRQFHSRFQLDIETGVGIDGSGQGTDPQVMLQWSDDGGHSWSNEKWQSIGPIGARLTRVIWRRLGVTRDRVYRVRIAEPVKVTLLGAELDVDGGVA